MKKRQKIYSSQDYVLFLNKGQESGLSYFYECFYEDLCARCKIATGDASISQTIVQEAFFRLWLFRTHMQSVNAIRSFLDDEIKKAIKEFYGNASEQFHRNFVQLDAFIRADHLLPIKEPDLEKKSTKQSPEERMYIKKINELMPHLRQDQQSLIRLCLEYGFNYDRIADYLGGRSSQEVKVQVQQTIAHIRSIFENTEKLQKLEKKSVDKYAMNLNPVEAHILRLRCDQHLSFDEIAAVLNIDLAVANNLFVNAYRKSRQSDSKSA